MSNSSEVKLKQNVGRPTIRSSSWECTTAFIRSAVEKIARERGVTAAQLAIAWVAARGPGIIPLIGTKRRERLAEAIAAFDITLTPEETAALEAAVPPGAVAGDRYDAGGMASLDSER